MSLPDAASRQPPRRPKYCFNCGAPIKDSAYSDAYDTCGELDCDREARYAWQAAEAERRERAEEDIYERY